MQEPKNALRDFFVELMTDPALWSRFQKEPEAVVNQAGLSDYEKKLMMFGPKDELKRYVEEGMGPNAPCLVIGFIIW